MITSGIYSITNTENGKIYVGSTVDLEERWEYHKQDLRRGAHHNAHLQYAWNKYGEEVFEFGILEYLDNLEELHLAEMFWANIYKEEGKELYNIAAPGRNPMLGRKHSVETRHRMSKSHMGNQNALGRIISEETRQRMREAQRNRSLDAKEEHFRKISEAKMGHEVSEETRCRISRANRGRKLSKETRRRMSEAKKGKKYALGCKRSDETRRRMSEAAKARWARVRGEING